MGERTITGTALPLDLLSVGVLVLDRFGGARHANLAWAEMTGQHSEQWRGSGWLDTVDDSDGGDERIVLAEAIAARRRCRGEWPIRSITGERRTAVVTVAPALAEDGAVRGFVATAVDVTDDRAESRALLHNASHDALTGLLNRAAFEGFVFHAIDRRRRDPERLAAVIFIDLNRLKEANDRFGHDAGDRLLRLAADRIRQAVRPSDLVARYGGDEFTVLCEDLHSPEEALAIARRIIEAARGSGTQEDVSLSVGVAVTDTVRTTAARLIRDADDAMYLAKDLRVFEPILNESRPARPSPPVV